MACNDCNKAKPTCKECKCGHCINMHTILGCTVWGYFGGFEQYKQCDCEVS